MATIPPYSWRVPLRSDKPAGAQQITDLATDVAATVQGLGLKAAAAGSRSHTTVNGWNSFTVTFPVGRFTAAPVVVVSMGISSASGIPLAGATSVTKDGCTVNVQHNAVIGVTVSWIAVQS